jgi:hypothetical protein
MCKIVNYGSSSFLAATQPEFHQRFVDRWDNFAFVFTDPYSNGFTTLSLP